jgi:hypothetical protein
LKMAVGSSLASAPVSRVRAVAHYTTDMVFAFIIEGVHLRALRESEEYDKRLASQLFARERLACMRGKLERAAVKSHGRQEVAAGRCATPLLVFRTISIGCSIYNEHSLP